jgi:hypothetical protein
VRSTSAFGPTALPALLLVLASSLFGCAGETGIIVEVTSPDLAVPADVDTLRFEAESALGLVASGTFPITSRWPHTLAIRPREGDTSGGITVRVVGLRGAVEVASTSVTAAFREGEIVTVEAVLSRCPGADCVLDGGSDLGVDLGGDAGDVPDGGVDDLGIVDLGVDDLGTDDLGTSDLGTSDAGTSDLGTSDLGVDLGLADLGTDFGPVDLGDVDLGDDLGPVDLGTDDLGPTDLGPDDMGPPPSLLGSLVISELATGGLNAGGTGTGTNEFVEIYNRTAVPIDIGGVTVSYQSAGGGGGYSVRATVPASMVLPAYSYYLFGSTAYLGTVTPDQPSAWSSGFNNAGGHIRLARGAEIIDTIGWGLSTSASPAVAPEGTAVQGFSTDAARSYERKAYPTSDIASMTTGADVLLGNGSDTNDNSADFIVRPTRDPQNLASTPEVP